MRAVLCKYEDNNSRCYFGLPPPSRPNLIGGEIQLCYFNPQDGYYNAFRGRSMQIALASTERASEDGDCSVLPEPLYTVSLICFRFCVSFRREGRCQTYGNDPSLSAVYGRSCLFNTRGHSTFNCLKLLGAGSFNVLRGTCVLMNILESWN